MAIDSQGRIRLPERLVHEALLEREVILIGVRNRAEIWNSRKWKEFQGAFGAKFDEVAQQALG